MWLRPSMDHIQPLSRKGKRGFPNLALAHGGCNEERGNADALPCERLYGKMLAECVFGTTRP